MTHARQSRSIYISWIHLDTVPNDDTNKHEYIKATPNRWKSRHEIIPKNFRHNHQNHNICSDQGSQFSFDSIIIRQPIQPSSINEKSDWSNQASYGVIGRRINFARNGGAQWKIVHERKNDNWQTRIWRARYVLLIKIFDASFKSRAHRSDGTDPLPPFFFQGKIKLALRLSN